MKSQNNIPSHFIRMPTPDSNSFIDSFYIYTIFVGLIDNEILDIPGHLTLHGAITISNRIDTYIWY